MGKQQLLTIIKLEYKVWIFAALKYEEFTAMFNLGFNSQKYIYNVIFFLTVSAAGSVLQLKTQIYDLIRVNCFKYSIKSSHIQVLNR